MMLETPLVRKAYIQMLTHEMKKVVRMLRAFPLEQLDARDTGCGRNARELAEGFIAHLRRLDAIASDSDWTLPPRGVRTRGSILLELETCYLGTQAAIEDLTPRRWSEVISSPLGLSPWSQARRGEVMWMALRNLIRHSRHFSLHLHAECRDRSADWQYGGSRVTERDQGESIGAGA